MNNEKFKSSKSASEEESQASPPEAELSVTGSEPRQRSLPSQSDTRHLPSLSSLEVPGNESSEDELEFVSPEPLSVSNLTSLVDDGWVVAVEDAQNSYVQYPATGSSPESEQQISLPRNTGYISSDMVRKLLEDLKNFVPATDHQERSYLNKWLQEEAPFEILKEILRPTNISSLRLSELFNRRVSENTRLLNCPSTSALENVPSRSLRGRPSIPALEVKEVSREISGTSESAASPRLHDSQPSSSVSENETHKSGTQFKWDKDRYKKESWTRDMQNALKDCHSPRQPQSSETESKSEKNADEPILGENSLCLEPVIRELADAVGVSSEESTEESSEGSPIKTFEDHFG